MKRKIFNWFLLSILFINLILFLPNSQITTKTLAQSPPKLLTPEDNSTISNNPKLLWEAETEAKQYRILIDNESNFENPLVKNYYTTNNSYSPQLEPNKYYWKVAARSQQNIWSEWSQTRNFTISNQNPSPNPSNSNNTIKSTDNSESKFIISNFSVKITSEDLTRTLVNISLPKSPNTKFYLKGSFKKLDSSNYLGLTKVDGEWIKNSLSSTKQFPITTDSSGSWSGFLDIKVDIDDSGFTGSGDYTFKVARYSQSGSGPIWSNDSVINITEIISVAANSNLGKSLSSLTPKSSRNKDLLTQDLAGSDNLKEVQVASIAGVSTESPKTLVSNSVKTNRNYLLIILGIIFLIVGSIMLFKFIKKS